MGIQDFIGNFQGMLSGGGNGISSLFQNLFGKISGALDGLSNWLESSFGISLSSSDMLEAGYEYVETELSGTVDTINNVVEQVSLSMEDGQINAPEIKSIFTAMTDPAQAAPATDTAPTPTSTPQEQQALINAANEI